MRIPRDYVQVVIVITIIIIIIASTSKWGYNSVNKARG